jgi:peptide/nickel transport system permease protein
MTAADVIVVSPDAIEPEPAGAPQAAWRRALTSREGVIGLTLGAVMVLVILVGPHVAPYAPNAIGTGQAMAGPSSAHLLGTDEYGRDVLSRILAGGIGVIFVPALAVAISFAIGGALGLIGAYRQGTVDVVITRAFDLLLAMPPLLLVLVLIAGFGASNLVLVLSVVLVYVPRVGRVLRGSAQAVIASEYVAAAEARGERTAAILVREIVPNIAAPAIAELALRFTYAIIFVATLNFLGLASQPPDANWGLMVASSRGLLQTSPVAALAPAVCIAILSVASNLIADAFSREVTGGRVTSMGGR